MWNVSEEASVQGLQQKERERHHAVAHCDKVAEIYQSTKTEAQARRRDLSRHALKARIKLHEEKSKKQVKDGPSVTFGDPYIDNLFNQSVSVYNYIININ